MRSQCWPDDTLLTFAQHHALWPLTTLAGTSVVERSPPDGLEALCSMAFS